MDKHNEVPPGSGCPNGQQFFTAGDLHVNITIATLRNLFFALAIAALVLNTLPARAQELPGTSTDQPAIVLTGLEAPTELKAVATSATTVDLTWANNASTALTIRIQRCEVKEGATCSDFAEIGSAGPNITMYTDQTAQEGKTYNYRAAAWGIGGYGPWSNVASATTPGGEPPPPPPEHKLYLSFIRR